MLELETKHQRSIEALLIEQLPLKSQTQIAAMFGISKGTLGYWLLKLGIRTEYKI